jgi:hypothetical protein
MSPHPPGKRFMLLLALYCPTTQAVSIPIKSPNLPFFWIFVVCVYSIPFSFNFLITPHFSLLLFAKSTNIPIFLKYSFLSYLF